MGVQPLSWPTLTVLALAALVTATEPAADDSSPVVFSTMEVEGHVIPTGYELADVTVGHRLTSGDAIYSLGFAIGDAYQREVTVGSESPQELRELVDVMKEVAHSNGWLPSP